MNEKDLYFLLTISLSSITTLISLSTFSLFKKIIRKKIKIYNYNYKYSNKYTQTNSFSSVYNNKESQTDYSYNNLNNDFNIFENIIKNDSIHILSCLETDQFNIQNNPSKYNWYY